MAPERGPQVDSAALLSLMRSSLPEEPGPQLRNQYDALALCCHACMLQAGFCLAGLGENHRVEAKEARPTALPAQWNATSSSDYAFRYTHDRSALVFLLKISRLGSKAVISSLALEAENVYMYNVTINDYLAESPFPWTLPSGSGAEAESTIKSLQELFVSKARLIDFASLLRIQIIQKLAPGLQKDGYEAAASSQTNEETPLGRSQLGESRPRHDPLREDPFPAMAQPRRPHRDPLMPGPPRPFPHGDFPPPDFEDEYEMNRPGWLGGPEGPRRPLNIGERDLYPPGLGPNDPLRGGGYGGLGGIGGGGMHPTFDDAPFRGDGGLGGMNPRAPPGARYDPVGPGDGPPNLRGPGGYGGPSGGPSGPFGPTGGPFGGFGGSDFI